MKTLKLLSVLLVSCFLNACATAPKGPTKAFVRTGSSLANSVPQISRVGVLTDAVLVYDVVGTNDYFVVEDSKAAAVHMLNDAKAFVAKKGFAVGYSSAPLIGGFKSSHRAAPIANSRGDQPTAAHFPAYVADEIKQDEPFKQALQHALQATVLAVAQKGELPEEKFRTYPALARNLGLIADRANVDYLLVAVGNGVIVSGGKQTGQVLGTTVLSTVMTLGLVSVSKHNVSFLDSYVALLDLRKAEILWSNSLRVAGNAADDGIYNGHWSETLLYHMPPCGTSSVEATARK